MTRKRIAGFDYRQPNAFFVTIVTHSRRNILGTLSDDRVIRSPIGDCCRDCWNQTPAHHFNIRTDAFIVMPNHIHGILWTITPFDDHRYEAFGAPVSRSVVSALRSYKAAVTRIARRDLGYRSGPVWQSGMWIHVIRDHRRLPVIRRYIEENPRKNP